MQGYNIGSRSPNHHHRGGGGGGGLTHPHSSLLRPPLIPSLRLGGTTPSPTTTTLPPVNNVIARPPSSTFRPIQMHFAPALDNLSTSLIHMNNNIDIAIPLCLPCNDDTNDNSTMRHLSTLTPSSSSSSYGGGNTIGDGNRGGSSGGGGCSPTPQNLRDNPERLAKVSTYYSIYINYDIFHVWKVILVFISSHSPPFLSSPYIHSTLFRY